MRRRLVAVGALVLLLAPAGSVAAQRPPPEPARVAADPDSEMARLRQAGAYEAAGNLDAATAVLAEVLERNPASLTALLAYERLLNVQGRPGAVLPAVDRLLAMQPASVLGHQVRLRVLAQVGDDAAVAAAAATWVRATPGVETPYREAALVWRQRGEARQAIALLEQGRRSIPEHDALALELGDAYAEAGDVRRAAAEWARAVGPDGRGFLLVQRRLQSQPDAGAAAITHLVEQLSGGPATPGRQRAAALLAIDAGLEPRAQRLASDLAARAPAAQREQVLIEVARRADGAGLYRLAAWSYNELLSDMRDSGAGLAIRTRVAELALLAGDTALAAEVYRQLEHASAAGSPQRREAMTLRLQLTIREADLDRATAQFDTFRSEFPRAPELDELAARLAAGYLDRGDVAAAGRVLAGVSGPHAARLRGRIYIRRGEIGRAREELLSAAPLLQGREATETIALVALLSRVSPAGGEFVAQVTAAAGDERAAIIGGALDATARMAPAERAAVLEFVATLADGSDMAGEADLLRGEIITQLARTHEAPAALLALARRSIGHAALSDDAVTADAAGEEARVLLEKLILDYPRSALAPQARRELERLPRPGARR
jgi:tetratricopeptide (TPR) repeat protein